MVTLSMKQKLSGEYNWRFYETSIISDYRCSQYPDWTGHGLAPDRSGYRVGRSLGCRDAGVNQEGKLDSIRIPSRINMQPSKKIIILVTDSASTLSSEDWERLFNSTAGTVDNRVHIAPLPPPSVDILKAPGREKYYWKPKYERLKHKR